MAKRKRIGILACLLICPLLAIGLELNPSHPDRYVVKQGDTLWDISALFLRKPWRWPEIWEGNPHIKNPHRIYPGDVLTLTFRDGRPVLGLSRGREVKLSPTLQEYPHDQAIPPIPLDAIWPFLSRPRVVGPDDLAGAPYILSSQDEHLISGTDNRVYVRGLGDSQAARYTVFRCGEVYRNLTPTRGEGSKYDTRPGDSQGYASTCGGQGQDDDILGYEAIHVADVMVERFGDPATARIAKAYREVLDGDRLLPEEAVAYPEFIPHPPARPVNGAIISVMDALSQVGPYQVVALNLGSQAGLEPGHVLAIYQSGVIVRDRHGGGQVSQRAGGMVELPHEAIGELMVFRIFPRVSYGLVMRAGRPVHVYDVVGSPE